MSFSNSFLLRRFEDLVAAEDRSSEEVSDPRRIIVLAESDPSELEHIASILRNLNFNVLTAGDGETALRLIREQEPVLVLSSLALSKFDGYKLCQALRNGKETESIPFMFIVENGEFPDHLIGHESYAHDYIQKPISVPEFKSRIQSLLNHVSSDDDPGDDSIPQPNRSNDLRGDGTGSETKAQTLELCEQLRHLLSDAANCLGQLEALMTADPEAVKAENGGTDEGEQVMRPQPLDIPSKPGRRLAAVEGDEEKKTQVDQYLAEYQERVGVSGSLGVGGEVNDGVEDLFSEFFALESAVRSSSGRTVKGPEEAQTLGGSSDPSETTLQQDGASEAVVAQEEREDDTDLYESAISYVLESIRGVVSGESPDIFRGAKLAELIVESLGESSALIVAATDREQDFAVSRHSVNVAVFAARVAMTLGQELQGQREVCLAGLLHEVGVGELPAKLIHKKESLSSEELRLIRRRPIQSGEIIANLGPEYVWLAEIVRQIAERENGTGDPIGLAGEEIDNRAKIIGIADVFDAYIHKRPYRDSISGYQTLFELTTDQQRAFSDQMVKALIRSFSLYPVNECVRLCTGEVGKVVGINPENLSRPLVTVLFDRDGAPLAEPKTVDLGRESALYIAEALVGRDWPKVQRTEQDR